MEDFTDSYLSQRLKNWAANQDPPGNIKARLLFKAAAAAAVDLRLDCPAYSQRNKTYLDALTRLPGCTPGTFHQPLLMVLRLSLTPIKP